MAAVPNPWRPASGHNIRIVGTNASLPRDAAQRTGLGLQGKRPMLSCGACGGTGCDYAYPVNLSAVPVVIDCARCNGQGGVRG